MHPPQPSATLPHRGTRYRRVGLERVRDRLGRGVRGGATRWLRPAGAALLGVAVGVGVALALQGPPDPPPAGSARVATAPLRRSARPPPCPPVRSLRPPRRRPLRPTGCCWRGRRDGCRGGWPDGSGGCAGCGRSRWSGADCWGLPGRSTPGAAGGPPATRHHRAPGDDRVRPGHLSGPAARLGQRRLRPAASRGGPAGSDLGPAAPPGAGGQAPGRSRSRAGRDQAVADHRRGGRRRPGRCGRGRGHHGRSQGGRDHPGPVPAARLPRRPGRGRRRGTSHPAGAAPGPAAGTRG